MDEAAPASIPVSPSSSGPVRRELTGGEPWRPGPWDSEPGDGAGEGPRATPPPPGHEPIFKAPWPPVALALMLLALYAVQSVAPDQQEVLRRFGFIPGDLGRGRWSGLVTALFVHGGWTHVVLNAVGALAFGAPVAKLFGLRAKGALAFAGFYLACGALSSAGFALIHLATEGRLGDNVLVGASGAVSGLMAGASRLIERRPSSQNGGLAPFRSPAVIGMAVAWLIVNLLVAVTGMGVGTGGAPVAWEAHLVGYAAGLLLIGPVARLLRRF